MEPEWSLPHLQKYITSSSPKSYQSYLRLTIQLIEDPL
jgi:hypothetical protein